MSYIQVLKLGSRLRKGRHMQNWTYKVFIGFLDIRPTLVITYIDK
jgi:hypothetical protein